MSASYRRMSDRTGVEAGRAAFRIAGRPSTILSIRKRFSPVQFASRLMESSVMPRIILASRSPRRRELLTEAGFELEVIPPSDTAECGLCSGENPAQLVARLAFQKADDVVRQLGAWSETGFGSAETPQKRSNRVVTQVVLGCDTVAECEGRILGKPDDEQHARAMLTLLSGRQHRVFSGLCVWPIPDGQPRVRVETTILRMDPLSGDRLDEYLASGQWQGKAGAFGYQDRLGWVHIEQGSASNVVGLPMELLGEMLCEIAKQG